MDGLEALGIADMAGARLRTVNACFCLLFAELERDFHIVALGSIMREMLACMNASTCEDLA